MVTSSSDAATQASDPGSPSATQAVTPSGNQQAASKPAATGTAKTSTTPSKGSATPYQPPPPLFGNATTSGTDPWLSYVHPKCQAPVDKIDTGAPPVKGVKPADFTATTLNCGKLTMSDYTKGHPAWLNFFASWCHPCQDEAPDIEAAYKYWGAKKGLVILAVDTADDGGDPSPFYKKWGYNFNGVWDQGTQVGQRYFGGHTVPVQVFLHADGTTYDMVIGSMTRADMDAEISAL
ncbi:MAG: TlpA family protein disulfide reductase [Candidatus Dormibacteria bacterium]